MTVRVQSAEEFLKSIVSAGLEDYGKGEWIAVVRSKLRDLP